MRKLLIDLENVLLNGNGHSDVYQNEPVADAREVLNSWKRDFNVVIFSSDVLKSSNWLNKYNLPHDIVISSDSKKGYEGNFLIDSDVDNLSRFSNGVPICFAKPENKLYGGAKVGSMMEAEFAVRVLGSYRK